MMKSLLELYIQLMNKYFKINPQIKQKFQIQLISHQYFGLYSNNNKYYIEFPIEYGKRLVIQINYETFKKLQELLSQYEKAAKRRDFVAVKSILPSIFEITVKNAKAFFVECTFNRALLRLPLQSLEHAHQLLDSCTQFLSSITGGVA